MNATFSKNIIKPLSKFSKICGISWSPNNTKLAVACSDKKIYLFDEQGNIKENFQTKAFKSENYEIIQILFNPDGTELAISQSDNIINIYKLGLNWEENKSIINKFELEAKPNCMIWSRTNTKEILFGLSNGEIRICLLEKNNTTNLLYKHTLNCVSISSSLDRKYIISGHKDCVILIYNIENHEVKKLVNHTCIPTCLAFGLNSSIFAAGNDFKVVIYNISGETVQNFDYSNNDDIKEFGCYSVNSSQDAIAFGNSNSFFIYYYNKANNKWEEKIIKIENYFVISSICWKPDKSALVVGNLINSVDIYDIYLKKKIYKNIYEFTFVTKNFIRVTNMQSKQYLNIKYQDTSKIQSLKISAENYFVIIKKETLILADLNQRKFSEIPWNMPEIEKFDLKNQYICIICCNKSLSLIEFGINKILFTLPSKNYSEEDLNKIKQMYYEYLISINQLDKAAKFKESTKDFKSEIDSYLKEGNPTEASKIFIKHYNKANYDKNILEKIIINLNESGLNKQSGELFEEMGQHQNAIDSYRKSKCFSNAILIAKKNNINITNELEEEWGEFLLEKKEYENAISHFLEAGAKEKAVKVFIHLKQWEKVIELVNNLENVNPLILKTIGNHFEKDFQYDKAEEYFIKAGELMKAFNMYINSEKFVKKEKSNEVLEKINEIKRFFEEFENNKMSKSGKNKQFTEEEKKIIIQKFYELKQIIFDDKNVDNNAKKESKIEGNPDKNTEIVYKNVIEGNINQNELNEETILKLIEYGKSVSDMDIILKLCKDLYQLLDFILKKFEHLLHIYKSEKKYIHLDKLIDIETNSLKKIMKIHTLLLQKEKENNYYLIKFVEIFKKHINFFKNRDIQNLLILKEMIYNHKKYGKELKELSIVIVNIIKNTFFYLIDEKAINSIEIIDYVLNLGNEIFELKEKKIFEAINIYELNENDYLQFCKLWDLVNNNNTKYSLMRIIFDKIEIFKDFGIIFKLIPNHLFDNIIANDLEIRFKKIFYSNFNLNSCVNVFNDIYKTIEIFISVNYPLSDFLRFIEETKNLQNKMISKLYLKLIEDKNLNNNKELKNFALNYLIGKNMINDIKSINSIVEIISSNNNNYTQYLLNVIKNYKINEDDFFNPNMLNKFKLYAIIYSKFFYNYYQLDYFKSSNISLSRIYNNIYKLELNYKQFNYLIDEINKDYFKEKLMVFNCMMNQVDEDIKIYEFIIKTKERFNNINKQLSKLENFLKAFFDNHEKNALNQIKKLNSFIKSKNIGSDLQQIEKFISKSTE